MGAQFAAIILAILGVVGAYNILTHPAADQAIIGSGTTGGANVIKALQGR